MKINILKAKYSGHDIVVKLNGLIDTNNELDTKYLKNPQFYNKDEINILVYDYTPVIRGNILIKYPNESWTRLRMNSKIFNLTKKRITYREVHPIKKSNWLHSIQQSKLNSIDIRINDE